jgi:hypothetical protein
MDCNIKNPPICVQAATPAEAERMAKDFAQVPGVNRGGEHIHPSETANLDAQQRNGRPEQVGRRMAQAQSGTAPNQSKF